MIDTALVLAGGLGTRLKSVVTDVPKPMALVNGVPFLEYLLDYWHSQGIRNYFISVGYKSDRILAYFGKRYRGATIKYVVEGKPLGTGGAFCAAVRQEKLRHPFLVLNGDTFFPIDLRDLSRFAFEKKARWCLSSFRSHDCFRYTPLEIESTGEIKSIKRADNDRSEILVNGGVSLINCSDIGQRYHKVPASLEEDILKTELLSRGGIYAYCSEAVFLDIGTPSDYARAPLFFNQWNG